MAKYGVKCVRHEIVTYVVEAASEQDAIDMCQDGAIEYDGYEDDGEDWSAELADVNAVLSKAAERISDEKAAAFARKERHRAELLLQKYNDRKKGKIR